LLKVVVHCVAILCDEKAILVWIETKTLERKAEATDSSLQVQAQGKSPATHKARCQETSYTLEKGGCGWGEEVPKASITKVVPPAEVDVGEVPRYRPETYLVDFMQTNVFSRLDSNEKVALRSLLIKHPEALRLGTICSGTDGPARLLDAFASAAAQALNLPDLQSSHIFSCEINSDKRNFINRFLDVQHIFGDVVFLAGPDARGYDYKGCSVCSAPQVGGIVFGFPCQDGSAQNPNRSQNRKVLLKELAELAKYFTCVWNTSKIISQPFGSVWLKMCWA